MFLRGDANFIFRAFWTCCCILGTLSTILWQLSNYCNIEEQTIVKYRRFNDIETDLYPDLTLCWSLAVNEANLKRYGKNLTAPYYASFLAGYVPDKKLLSVDYDDVMTNFDDYVLQYGYQSSSAKDIILYDKKLGLKSKPGYKEGSVLGTKCFSIESPFIKGNAINGLFVYFKSGIFGKGGRLANPAGRFIQENQFQLRLNFRDQLTRVVMVPKYFWPFRGQASPSSYLMRVKVDNIDVLVRRNTYQNPCINGIPKFDQSVMHYILEKVKCKPPYWNSTSTFDNCSDQKQLKQLSTLILESMEIGNIKDFYTVPTPCRSLERVSYDSIDVETPEQWMEQHHWTNDTVEMIIDFREWTYREVTNMRGMDVQSLIGKCNTDMFK